MGFYALPAVVSAYLFGRRQAVLTAFVSILLVGLVSFFNPHRFDVVQLAGIGGDVLGQLMIVGGALCYSITQVLVKRNREGSPVVGAACSLTCSSLWTLPMALLVEAPWQRGMPGTEAILSLLAVGLFCTGFTHYIFFLLLRRTGPQFVTLNNYIVPGVALVLGIVLRGERPLWTAYAALAVIAIGIFVATRPSRARAPAPAAAR